MANITFMTGFPGFLARHLIARLARSDPEQRFVFLVQRHLLDQAKASIQSQDATIPGLAERCDLVVGDITAGEDLGLSTSDLALARKATRVWHMAAIYNLAIDLPAAYRVNVTGTANVLDFCRRCDKLERLLYVSTCYVSGDRTGRVLEDELDNGQGFKNHYESTKCWAEIEVRRNMEQIPTSVFRPSVVVGDSKTGDTDKYDGPYYLIRALLKVPTWIPIPFIGPGRAALNVVPVDFLTRAMAALSGMDDALGKTFHMADPDPVPNREVLKAMVELTGHRLLAVTAPSNLVERLSSLRFMEEYLQMPAQTTTYINHEVLYDTANTTRMLEGTGISCPNFLSYLPIMVDYVKRNPNKSFLDGRKL